MRQTALPTSHIFGGCLEKDIFKAQRKVDLKVPVSYWKDSGCIFFHTDFYLKTENS